LISMSVEFSCKDCKVVFLREDSSIFFIDLFGRLGRAVFQRLLREISEDTILDEFEYCKLKHNIIYEELTIIINNMNTNKINSFNSKLEKFIKKLMVEQNNGGKIDNMLSTFFYNNNIFNKNTDMNNGSIVEREKKFNIKNIKDKLVKIEENKEKDEFDLLRESFYLKIKK